MLLGQMRVRQHWYCSRWEKLWNIWIKVYPAQVNDHQTLPEILVIERINMYVYICLKMYPKQTTSFSNQIYNVTHKVDN